MDVTCINYWITVVDNLMTHDKTTYKDLMGEKFIGTFSFFRATHSTKKKEKEVFNLTEQRSLDLSKLKDKVSDKLIISQTTNLRLSQTGRFCRRQFQIWWIWQKVLLKGRKQCGKRRNCSLRAISPFPTLFSKGLSCRHVKTRACLGRGLLVTVPFKDSIVFFLEWLCKTSLPVIPHGFQLYPILIFSALNFSKKKKNDDVKL